MFLLTDDQPKLLAGGRGLSLDRNEQAIDVAAQRPALRQGHGLGAATHVVHVPAARRAGRRPRLRPRDLRPRPNAVPRSPTPASPRRQARRSSRARRAGRCGRSRSAALVGVAAFGIAGMLGRRRRHRRRERRHEVSSLARRGRDRGRGRDRARGLRGELTPTHADAEPDARPRTRDRRRRHALQPVLDLRRCTCTRARSCGSSCTTTTRSITSSSSATRRCTRATSRAPSGAPAGAGRGVGRRRTTRRDVLPLRHDRAASCSRATCPATSPSACAAGSLWIPCDALASLGGAPGSLVGTCLTEERVLPEQFPDALARSGTVSRLRAWCSRSSRARLRSQSDWAPPLCSSPSARSGSSMRSGRWR